MYEGSNRRRARMDLLEKILKMHGKARKAVCCMILDIDRNP
jgi:hypothetical protein